MFHLPVHAMNATNSLFDSFILIFLAILACETKYPELSPKYKSGIIGIATKIDLAIVTLL